MSDKTPPPDQPESTEYPEYSHEDPAAETTPEPAAGQTGESTDAHTTHEGTPYEHTTHEGVAGAPVAAREKRRRAILVPLIAVVVVIVLVAGGLAAFFLTRSNAHKIVTPASAGGMKRDTQTETQLKSALTDAEKQFKAQDTGITSTASAIYAQDDSERGPKGGLVFLGGKLKESDEKSASKFLSTVRKQATSNGFKVTTVDPGSGAKALCAAQAQGTQKIAICAWATDDTRGELLPTVSGWETPTLSKVMKSLRADVEVKG